MAHIVLLGDSIFDNKAYVGGEPDVVAHLQSMIPPDWTATLMAVDGSLAENVGSQLASSPKTATHLVISTGGNNALMNTDVLNLEVRTSAEVFRVLSNRLEEFERQYQKMLETVLRCNLPTAVCTIYNPNFVEPLLQKIATVALSAFNDVIIRQAISARIPFLDLRLVCSERSDYANEIEPSSAGGRKIAAKILETIENHDFSFKRTSVYF
jgi:hypothetical protein